MTGRRHVRVRPDRHSEPVQADDDDLLTVLERLVRLLRQMSTVGELSLAAASLLATLDDAGPARLSDLAALQRVSQPGMSQLVRRLQDEGLVARRTDPRDARVVVVVITAAGRQLLRQRRGERAAALRRRVSRLTPREQALLRSALPALRRLTETAE